MGFHLLKNERGQLNVEFIIATILLALVVVSAAIAIIRLLPSYSTAADDSALRARATDFAKVLFDSPGKPANWTANPAVVGLTKVNNYSNETIRGVLDPVKVSYLNNSIPYSQLKQNLSIEVDFNFKINISNQTFTFLDYFNSTPGRTDKTITITKLAVVNKSQVNISLLVWR